jgi:hypothetical protein
MNRIYNRLIVFLVLTLMLTTNIVNGQTDSDSKQRSKDDTSLAMKAGVDIMLGADHKKIRDLTGLSVAESMAFISPNARSFIWKDGKFNEMSANKETFNAAVENVTSEKIRRAETLLVEKNENPKSLAFLCLVGATSEFVKERGKINKEAFDEALANITPAMITKVRHIINDPEASEPLFVLLKTSGYYVDKSGRFDKSAFNKALETTKPEDIEAMAKELKELGKEEAFCIILRKKR